MGRVEGVQVVINEQQCRSCGICYELCPEGVLGAHAPLYKAEVLDINKCTACRLCEWLCTDWAIDVIVPAKAASGAAGA